MNPYRLTLLDWLILAIATPLIYLLGLTIRIREAGKPEWGPRASQSEPPLWVLWHETILMGIWHHRHRGVHVMISTSRDGELVATLGKFFGYNTVRGSSTRGGKEASLEMVECLKWGERCAITPDGPRGPRREMKMGAVNIARQAGCPVVPYGFAAEHCWRLTSWDRFIIPKPFSRAVFVYGDPIRISREGGKDEEYMDKIQKEMDRVTREAEGYFRKNHSSKA